MPVQPYDFNIDPRERVEREQRRLQRLTDPKTYAPGASRRQPRMRRGSEAFELDEETRQGLLSTIGENTMGALYKFSNVLDLPGSSIRDIASTVTGTPRNPFDQWLSPTTERGRIRGRELNRQWGLAGNEDNWKNLIGGMATEIGLDPLTYLGFGANALTKHGQLLKRAGVLDQLPSYRYWKGVERAGDKASPLSTMGKREALQEITNAEDLIKHIGRGSDDVGDAVMQQQARDAVEQAAKSVGYGSYEDFLAKEGHEALSGVTRFGLPNWRIFGANPKDMLRQAPGKILGTPGSEGAKRYARTMDEAFRKVAESTPFKSIRPLFDPRVTPGAGMLSSIGQRAAPAFKAASEAGEASARRTTRDAVMDFQRVFGDDWEKLRATSSDEEILDIHNKFRGFFEMGKKHRRPLNRDQRQVVDHFTKAITSQYKRAKDGGASMELLDDDFISYFPRELTEGLDTGWVDLLRQLDPTSPTSLPTSAFSQHYLARLGPLRDLPEGTETINRLWTDPKAIEIIGQDLPRQDMKKQLAKYISDTYGQAGDKSIPAQYRGISLNRTNLDSLPPARQDEVRQLQAKIYGEDSFSDIYSRTDLNDVEKKQLLDDKLREMNVRTDTNWVGSDAAARITGDTRLWEVRNDRHQVLAEMFMNSPEKAHERGLFGNLPLYDAENYFQRMEDAINRSNFTQSMLSHPQALRQAEAGDVGGESLRKVLRDLSLDEDTVIPNLAKRHGLHKGDMTEEAWRQRLNDFANRTVEMGLNQDLKRYKQFIEGPEAASFAINIYDNLQKVFKAHVTSPWPAFHGRNIMTGLLREAIQGRFSFRDLRNTARALAGSEVQDATQIPFVQQRWADMQKRIPSLAGQQLSNEQAHKILMNTSGETRLVGSYQLHEGADAVTEMRAMGGSEATQLPAGAGRARFFEAETPGSYPYSLKHAGRSYLGRGQKVQRPIPGGGFETITTPPTTSSPIPQVTPFPGPVGMPLWLAGKGIAKGYKALRGEEALRASPRLSKWADAPFWRQPREWRVPGVEESLGLKGAEGRQFSDIPGSLTYGPVAGGREIAYGAEFINRFEPWLNLVRKGWDPHMAAREIGGSAGSQISYASKHFTPFENQVMKRIIPFWSFTSRSVPWSIRKFYEEPHNPLAQVIRGTKRTGEHLQEKHQDVGPVPAHIRDSLAIPMQSEYPGNKRFFTGMDLMSQDLWQLGMPLLAGEADETLYEIAGRSNPLLKFLAESVTGTSLWQRGVEEGRPIRTMSPTVGRTLANMAQTWEKLSGEEYPSGYYENLSKPGLLDRVASASPYTRGLSTARTLFDVRKGPGAKALRLGMGAGITDIGPRQQQAILREYLRSMIDEAGGRSFTKATFSKEDLARMDPEARQRALQLKALSDEQADIAKDLREKARMGMPGY